MTCEGVEEKTSSNQPTRKSGNKDEIIKEREEGQSGKCRVMWHEWDRVYNRPQSTVSRFILGAGRRLAGSSRRSKGGSVRLSNI
jgi:hypothetical protein